MLTAWQRVFRVGLAPLLSTTSLEALRLALVDDDPKLIQGATTTPYPLQCVSDWPVEAACAVSYCGVVEMGGFEGQSQAPCPVKDAEEFFARMCFDIDQKLGEPAACRYFINWFDDTPRDEMRKSLLEEVQLALAERLREEPTETVQ